MTEQTYTDHVRDVFDNTARTYDFLNHLFSFTIDSRWRARLVKRSEARSGARVLDVCCGTGDVALAFAHRIPNSSVVAIDFSQGMLERARTKIEARGLEGRIALAAEDALALPYAEESFDVAVNSFGIRTLEDRPKAISEMVRVTRKGGRVLLMEFLPPPPTLFGHLYSWYLNSLMPFFGGLFSHYRASYSYLSDTVATFPSTTEMLTMMGDAGLGSLESESLTGGIAHLFYGTKGGAA